MKYIIQNLCYAHEVNMNVQEIVDAINNQLVDLDHRCLNSTEIIVLGGICENKTYQEIAKEEGYSSNYFANVVAPELYKILSQITGKRVTKKNCKTILGYCVKTKTISLSQSLPQALEQSSEVLTNSLPIYPSGAVPLSSQFYLKRSSLEKQILEEITKPGALVRIKAPQERGKTSLLLRILDTAQKQLGYKTISLNLQKADQNILSDNNTFLRWVCINCARQLRLKPELDKYWDDELGHKMAWTVYFEDYILEQIEGTIVLAFDEVNEIFQYPSVAGDFLPLLRSCFEEAKRTPLWQKLRLIVVHSTEIYVTLKLEQSPFNVGYPVEVKGFNQSQIQELAKKYGFNWKQEREIKQLIDLVAGHPLLIHLAIYYLYQGETTFSQLLENATTNTGIYSHHLQRHWIKLQERPKLATVFKDVCHANSPIPIDPIVAYQLHSMGLIDLKGNEATVSCRLYKDYFYNQWQESDTL